LEKQWIIHQYKISAPRNQRMLIDCMASFKRLLDELIVKFKENNHPDDHIQFVIFSDETNHPIATSYKKIQDVDSSFLLTAIQLAAQSGFTLEFNHNIQLHVKHVLTGGNSSQGGRRKFEYISSKIAAKKRRSLIEINNFDDNMCMARALVIGLILNEKKKAQSPKDQKKTSIRYKRIIDSGRKRRGSLYFEAKGLQNVESLIYG